jgi:hypothetical protein
MAARTQLQISADLVGHAALYKRDTMSAEDAKLAALAAAESTMPSGIYGVVLTADDIRFGVWDSSTEVFTVNELSRSGVLVATSRLAEKANPVSSLLMQFIGFSRFDLKSEAVFVTFRPSCFREGFVAEGVVDLQSNNGFSDGFCVHSNTYVSLNQNNTFEAGTVVSMPNSEDIDLPQSGFERNEGLEAALREGYYRMRLVDKLPTLITEVSSWGSKNTPSYINSVVTISVTPQAKKINNTMFTPGRIHTVCCSAGGTITVEGGTYSNVVLATNCNLKFGSGAALENAVFATTSTNTKSMTAPSGLRIGKNDNCAEEGEAQLLTLGGMDFAADLQMYGGQLVASGTVQFAANAHGIQGASFIAGGEISGTSNMEMGFCVSGMDNNFGAEYFRLAI